MNEGRGVPKRRYPVSSTKSPLLADLELIHHQLYDRWMANHGTANGEHAGGKEMDAISLLAVEQLDSSGPDNWISPSSNSDGHTPPSTEGKIWETNASHGSLPIAPFPSALTFTPAARLYDGPVTQEEVNKFEETIRVLEQLPPEKVAEKIRSLEEWAYSLGIQEKNELQRGKVLNILQMGLPQNEHPS